MKNNKYYIWLIIVGILSLVFVVRFFVRVYYKPRCIFRNLKISAIEYQDKDNKQVVIKKENNEWLVITPAAKYNGDKQKINTLIEQLNKFEILELVSNKPSSYLDYNLDENTAKKIKVKLDKRNIEKIIWLGKTGGFSYNEIFTRIDNKPEIYLCRGISAEEFNKPFYEYCNRTILKSKIDAISFIQNKVDNKTFEYRKELKNGATVWINVKTNKEVNFNKVDGYLRFFDEFIGDIIIESSDYNLSLLKSTVETLLKYDDGTEIRLYFYDKIPVTMPQQWGADCNITYPVKIKCLTSKGPSIEIIGNENIVFGIYDFRYKDFKEMPAQF